MSRKQPNPPPPANAKRPKPPPAPPPCGCARLAEALEKQGIEVTGVCHKHGGFATLRLTNGQVMAVPHKA